MKKFFRVFAIMGLLVASTFAATYTLPNNDSSKVRTTPKLTGTNYMKALHSVKLVNVPANATKATLTTTLDKKGTVKINYIKNTFTITVGYTSCKVAQYVSWKELPKTVTVDLTNLKCLNKKNPVNLLPELKEGKRINIFFAKQNGITRDTKVTIK